MEDLNLVQLLAHAHKLDGLAGDRLDGEGRAAPGVAVQLGEHHAADVQGVVEGLGGVHRVLANHGVHHQENFGGVDGGLDGPKLIHQLLVHVEPAGGVQKDHVVAVLEGVLHRGLGDVHGINLPHLEDGDVQLLAHHFQLLDGGGAVDVAGHQQGALAVLLFHKARQLGHVGGLAGALKAHHHHNGGGLGGDGQLGAGAAHELGELLVDDFDNHLGRGEGLQHVGPHRLLRHLGDELLDHLVADVGLQQSQADFPHGLLYIGLRQAALAPQLFEGGGELFGKSFKCHGLLLQQGVDGVIHAPQQGLQLPVVIAGGELQRLAGILLDLLQLPVHGVEALDEAGLVLQLGEGGLGPDDDVPDALAGDVVVLRNLTQGQVLIVIEVVELLLAIGEHVAVKIEEHRHAIGLIFHSSGPPSTQKCKGKQLYKRNHTTFALKCQVKLLA